MMLSVKLRLVILLLGISFGLGGCATNAPSKQTTHSSLEPVLAYYDQLPSDHPDRLEAFFYIPQSTKDIVKREFSSRFRDARGTLLAEWLMSPDDHSMIYDIDANLRPHEVFEQRRGNCLSFTLLMMQLSKELGLTLRVNQVDLPDMWGQSENQDLVFYRHVNAIQKTNRFTHVYDLALQDYRTGYPQRLLTEQQGAALLFSNKGLKFLQKGDTNSAFHYLKLAVSLHPNSADMWINLGSAYKKSNQWSLAENSYLKAFDLDFSNSLAASNLDRLYRLRGQPTKAAKFTKLANMARLRNPYIRYANAQTAFAERRYRTASKEVRHAIRLHDKDPQFFELSSRIKQSQKKYIAALKDLESARKLSSNADEVVRYTNKVEMVIERVKQQVIATSDSGNERAIRRLRSAILRYNN
jgi:Flp pilus assembly protein TadD